MRQREKLTTRIWTLLALWLTLIRTSEAVSAYVNWGDYDVHGGMDYEWYDPYVTESLFTDYKGYVTELHAKPEDGPQFNVQVYYSKKPWMVIFYAHWCGHCHQYVPTFKKFVKHVSNSTHSWRNTLNIGTVNCGSDKVKVICRQQAINSYPQIKYYKPYLSPKKAVSGDGRRGIKHDVSKAPGQLLKNASSFLAEYSEFKTNQNPGWKRHWRSRSGQPAPVFDAALSYEMYKKFRAGTLQRTTKSVVYLTHRSLTTIQQVILDMSGYRGVQIFFKVAASSSAKGIAMIYTDGKKTIKTMFYTRLLISERLRRIPCVALGIDVTDRGVGPGYDPSLCSKNDEFTPKPVIPNVPIVKATPAPDRPKVITTTEPEAPKEDLPSSDHAEAISKMLNDEIPSELVHDYGKAKIAARVLQFLLDMKHTLNILPTEARVMQTVVDYLGETSAREYDEDQYMAIAASFPATDLTPDWSDACRGSTRARRGYTCTLWRLFHTLSVHCAYIDKPCSMNQYMIDYITNFFSCSDCVSNFRKEIRRDPPPRNSTGKQFNKEEIMWLWTVHNKVNKRLAGDHTEDPEHPKIQFPSKIDCHSCYKKDSSGKVLSPTVFNRDGVHDFLMQYYKPRAFPTPEKRYQWPVGHYGFVKTRTGCPDGFQSWRRSQDTENYRPSNSFDGDWQRYISSYTGITGLGTMMSWEFCMKRNSRYPTHQRTEWPEGNYCIVKHNGKSCPRGFDEGWVYWNDENENNQNKFYGSIYSKPSGVFDRDTQIDFCCRDDGNVRTKIVLPTDAPYTLFPYTSKRCQRVRHKTPKRAWFMFDYEDDDQGTQYENMMSEHGHPYLRQLHDGMRLYICVYHN